MTHANCNVHHALRLSVACRLLALVHRYLMLVYQWNFVCPPSISTHDLIWAQHNYMWRIQRRNDMPYQPLTDVDIVHVCFVWASDSTEEFLSYSRNYWSNNKSNSITANCNNNAINIKAGCSSCKIIYVLVICAISQSSNVYTTARWQEKKMSEICP